MGIVQRLTGGRRSRRESEAEQRLRLVTPSPAPQYDTDPAAWAYAAPPPFQPPAPPFDSEATLVRWAHQISRDRTNQSVVRFAHDRPEFTHLYLRMRDLGKYERARVFNLLNERFDHPIAGDPELEGYYSPRRIIRTLCELHHIEPVQMSDLHKVHRISLSSKDDYWGIYAMLETFADARQPLLAVDIHPCGEDRGDPVRAAANMDYWTFAAACCLAAYLFDKPMYMGRGAPRHTIAPFNVQRDAGIIPLTHAFAKALLHYEGACPYEWPCKCNSITQLFHLAPEKHPWQTGELPANVAAAEVSRQKQQWQQPDPAAFGSPAAPSQYIRQNTPPGGTSGELLKQYLRENRYRNTNPKGGWE